MKNQIKFIVIATIVSTFFGCSKDQSSGSGGTAIERQVKPAADPYVLMLSDRALQLAGVTTGTVGSFSGTKQRRITGRLVSASAAESALSPRFSGRVVKLFAKDPGKVIRRGDPIAEIYSPELSALAGEHLILIKGKISSGQSLVLSSDNAEASRQKLIRAGMREEQIASTERTNTVPSTITWLAEISGNVSEVLIREGGWVNAGTTALRLKQPLAMRVEVGLYPQEWGNLRIGDHLEIRFANGQITAGTIEELLPETDLDVLTRPVRLRPDRLPVNAKEGDLAEVRLAIPSATGVRIPDAAIARIGGRAGIFRIIAPGAVRFERIATAESSNGWTHIPSGLRPGDTIAMSGAWLLHAELSARLGESPLSIIKNEP